MSDLSINARFETYIVDLQTEHGQEIKELIAKVRKEFKLMNPLGSCGNDTLRIDQITEAMEIEDPHKRLERIQQILCARNDTRWALRKAS